MRKNTAGPTWAIWAAYMPKRFRGTTIHFQSICACRRSESSTSSTNGGKLPGNSAFDFALVQLTVYQAAEKLKFLSFRGTLRAEESLILLTLEPREISHFVRNDKITYFFRSLFSRDIKNS